MGRRDYLIGWGLGAVWIILGVAVLYALSLFMEAPTSLNALIGTWLAIWPLGVGFYAGWRRGEAGFSAGTGVFVPPYLLFSLLWWWMLPALFSLALCAKALLAGIALSAIAGGLGAGFQAARRQLAESSAEN